MKGKNIQMTKVVAVMLSIALVVGMLPASFITALAANEQMGTLSAITTGGMITDASAEEATVTYDNGTLKLDWDPAFSEVGRISDGWWVGVKMTAPENMTKENDFANVYYRTGEGKGWSKNKHFWEAQDSDKTNPDTIRYLTMWGMVNEELLNNALISGEPICYKWQFDWDQDGIFEQTANLKIDPSKVILTKDGKQEYPSTDGNGKVSAISEGLAVQGTDNANIVKALLKTNQSLTWCEKDTTVGRYNDGWWAGIKITAPSNMTTEASFENVKYQTKTGETWSEDKYFWDKQDSDINNPDTERYLTMWGLLNESLLNAAVSTEKNLAYSWRFDWDGDGVYEQVLLLEIDPSKIVLNDKAGNQVYPKLGEVFVISGGSISGVTGNTVVTADELTLNWSAKEPSIGRNKDGWWAGIKITAPEGLMESQLEGVKYKRLIYGEDNWSEEKSFWKNKDSKPGTSLHFMEMWMHLTPAIIREAIEANKNITNQYLFDWNQDGIFEQLVTFTVVPSGKIILTKVEQTGFKFETEAPVDQWIGKTYKNEASGGKGTGEITYSIESGSNLADVNTKTGEVTFKGIGRVTVKATKAADDTYAEATATYSVTSMKLPQEEFKFKTTGPVEITYEPNRTYTNIASGGVGTGDVRYKIISGDCASIDAITGEVTINRAGTVTVEATKSEDNLYKGKSVTYLLTINKAEQKTIILKAPTEITYNPTAFMDILTYSGGSGNGEVKYEIIDGKDVATVETKDGKGTITALKAGKFTVKLTIGGDDCYNEASASATIVVKQADQTTFKFSNAGAQTVTYNENGNKFLNKAEGGESTSKELTYRIISGGDCASINELTGELTVIKAGTVVIEATKGEDACYNSAAIKYTLEIERANQTFSFSDGKEISKLYGVTEYTNKATENAVTGVADGKGYGMSAITYSIVEDGTDIGAKIDAKTGRIIIGDSEDKIGTITVKATKAQDDCYNEYSDTYKLSISYLETPASSHTLSEENKGKAGWYIGTVKIKAPQGYQISYDNEITTATWADYVEFDKEGINKATVYLKDADGFMTNAIVTEDIKIDTENPTDLTIDYSDAIMPWWQEVASAITFGYYNPQKEKPFILTLTAEDITSGIDYLVLDYMKEAGSSDVNEKDSKLTIPSEKLTYLKDGKIATYIRREDAQRRGSYKLTAFDRAGNSVELNHSDRINVIDTIAPERTITYSDARVLDETTMLDVSNYVEGDKVILYYEKEADVTINIKEANFYKEDVIVAVAKDGSDYPVKITWDDVSTDEHVGTFKLSGNGDYKVTVTYKDRSDNEMLKYESQKIAIDDEIPTVDVEYESISEVANEKYYKADRIAKVTIVEHNFRADDVVAKVTAKDATGENIAKADKIAKEVSDYLSNRDNWSDDGDKRLAEIPFKEDAEYILEIDYKDIVGNQAETSKSKPFVVDHEAPTDLTIDYSKETKFWEEVKEAITFGYYSYKPEVIVTITATDITSGVDYFEWKYTREDGASTTKNVAEEGDKIIKTTTDGEKLNEISYSVDRKTATTSFKLTADEAKQYRGHISFTATDMAGNTSISLDDVKHINIVDTIEPKRVVTYSEANRIVDATTLKDMDNYEYTGENTNAILYYNDKVTATFKITEANFHEEDVVIKVNDVEKVPTVWTQSGDEWTATITIEDEGDYIVTMTYSDRSNNEMLQYKSQRIVIDKTVPVVDVVYTNEDVKNIVKDDEGHGRKYFNKIQTATITIKEHNFRADDVVIKVNAKNISGANVNAKNILEGKVSEFTFDANGNVEGYAAQGSNRAEWAELSGYENAWRRVDDTYQLVVEYSADANYTFDVEYKDLATNSIADYTADYFTVDKTAPTGLVASYSTNIVDKVIESVTFGYYNAQMTVTIQAVDETSGIYHFMYSYLKAKDVSNVNAELLNQAIAEAEITRVGKTSIATFKIPEKILQNNNQFNGMIEFTAYDRSENKNYASGNIRVVVDNISPTVQVSYNQPVQNANGISYYAGDINATMVINEANFYSEDVVVRVTRDGRVVTPSVTWVDNSVDVHTGTFTLHEDGDYFVTVEYADRSSNKMPTYTSNELTIDTKTPTIQVLPIKMNSANKDEVFGFTITADDINIDASSFKPVLNAVLREKDGSYKATTVSLGDIQVVTDGQTYTYSVANLKEDAVYSMTCIVKDMSGNEYSMINLSDGKRYEEIMFSVNREGSTYYVDESTSKIVEQYYVYSVENDIVIEEINVDPVENYVVKLNGTVLKEGSDYTTRLSNNANEWSKRIYIINKALFKTEGEYNIVIESTDKTETTAYSDVKGLKVAFVVDQTKPVLTISGLENSGRYQVNEQVVTVIPTDDGGRLNSFKVIVLDRNGNPIKDKNGKDISVRFNMSGEKLLKYLEEHDGKITFTIPEGLENQVQIICSDCAMNTEGFTNEYNETFAKVTVSQSGLVIYYANKPLFYGSIASILAVIVGIIWFIVYKKKSNEDEES